MALSIDHNARIIHVPNSFLTPVSGSLYELDINTFRLALKDLEDNANEMTLPDTHRHNTEVILSGAVFARILEIINSFRVQFDDDILAHYTVRCVGGNHNIADVVVPNTVSLIIGNSAGLINTLPPATAAAIADEVRVELALELARLDVAVSTRLADADYTPPPAVAAFWAYVVEAGMTAEEMMRLLASVSVANAVGLNGTSMAFRDLNNTKNRVVGTVIDGVRTITTKDGT